ncbi:hypothetical protein OBV_15280 [Oscillibacter valericigenes Sjm18-20]|nr:hypothetical protein OBV_15280 [Oscillibacter valericigenes Sjm18-20]
MILTLSAILFVLIAIIGREKGVKTFCSAYANFFMIIFSAILIMMGVNPIAVGLIFSVLFSIITLFWVDGCNHKTVASFFSVLIVLILTGLFIWWIGMKSNISGFPAEYSEEIAEADITSSNVQINFFDVFVTVILMGLIGSITDAALDAATTVNEIYQNNKNMPVRELIISGLNVGGDILGTMVNTLFFAFWGTFMGYFIWHQGESMMKVLNGKAFAFEYIRIAFSGLGCILVIPISCITTSILLKKFPPQN